MIDWIFDHLGWIFILVVSLIVVFAFIFGCEDNKEHERLMQECMKDHKEYECYSMLKSCNQHTNSTYVPMPMIIR